MDLTNSIVRVLARGEEISQKKLNILLVGDSTCSACLFSPSITIKNVLLCNVVTDVKQRIKEVLEMVPESTVQLALVPSHDNSADMVSKMFHNPFVQTNSNLCRHGLECFREMMR